MEVVPKIHQFGGMSNCYLVEDEEMMLIDTGNPVNTKKILNYMKNTLNRNPEDIKTIVITHHHFDHIGSLGKLKKVTGAKLAAHKDDANYIAGKEKPEEPFISKIFINLLKIIYRSKTVEVDILLEENDKIGSYKIIHTPGHTPGSICLYNENDRIIFVGDNLTDKGDKIGGPPSIFTLNMEQANESIKKLENLDIDVIFTGHGKIISEAKEKLKEYIKML
ncbi:MBL fold metallo-hydrolase [Methanobacterium oryzae]|uniref:MBL fold metallo-hydrolase n=1 Tax=Methanobacterium oryzae TaxID=69540 RepID=UPI003D1987B0